MLRQEERNISVFSTASEKTEEAEALRQSKAQLKRLAKNIPGVIYQPTFRR